MGRWRFPGPTAATLAALIVGSAGLGTAPVAAAGRPVVGGTLLGSSAIVVARGAPTLPPGLTASSWLVADATTGAVLAARNPHGRFGPASTLKILTALTLLPRLNPRRIVAVTNADEMVDGTKVGLVPGLRVRLDQAFTAMLVVSGNDAANVLARAAGGTATTVALMSAEARRLQALDTVPRTVHGLDAPGQSSSAYDLALLGRAGLALPAFRRYVAIRRAWMPARGGKFFEIDNHNRLLTRYPGAIGIKNGHTDAARSSLVAAARRGNRTMIVTLMHADARMWDQAVTLLDWGFRADGRAAPVGTLVGPVPEAIATPKSAPPALTLGAGGNGRDHRDPPPVRTMAVGGAIGLLLAGGGFLLRRRRT
ncbi:MAG: serine hydrolase [Frankiaceae bacterium]